jgi:hypothetical protein
MHTYILLIQPSCRIETDSNSFSSLLNSFNRRSLDILSAKAYFYLSLSFERLGKTEQIRPLLLTLYRTCCVRRDEMGQVSRSIQLTYCILIYFTIEITVHTYILNIMRQCVFHTGQPSTLMFI